MILIKQSIMKILFTLTHKLDGYLIQTSLWDLRDHTEDKYVTSTDESHSWFQEINGLLS